MTPATERYPYVTIPGVIPGATLIQILRATTPPPRPLTRLEQARQRLDRELATGGKR